MLGINLNLNDALRLCIRILKLPVILLNHVVDNYSGNAMLTADVEAEARTLSSASNTDAKLTDSVEVGFRSLSQLATRAANHRS